MLPLCRHTLPPSSGSSGSSYKSCYVWDTGHLCIDDFLEFMAIFVLNVSPQSYLTWGGLVARILGNCVIYTCPHNMNNFLAHPNLVKGKVKVVLEHAVKANWESRGVALLFLNSGTGWR